MRSRSNEMRRQSSCDSPLAWMAGPYYPDISESQTAFTGRVLALSVASIYGLSANNSLNKVRFEDRIRITNATGGAFAGGAAYQAQGYEFFTSRATRASSARASSMPRR